MGQSYNVDNPNGYDVSIVYSSSSNRYGVGKEQRTKFPENILAAGASIVQQHPELGYRTLADLVRDAYVHRLHWLQTEYPQVKPLVSVALLQANQEQRKATHERLENMVKNYTDEIRDSYANPSRLKQIRQDLDELINLVPHEFSEFAVQLSDIRNKIPIND